MLHLHSISTRNGKKNNMSHFDEFAFVLLSTECLMDTNSVDCESVFFLSKTDAIRSEAFH